MKNIWQYDIQTNPIYGGKVIAIVDFKIFDYADTYEELIEKMKLTSVVYSVFHVPRNIEKIRILSF
jgi:hypothetical protein